MNELHDAIRDWLSDNLSRMLGVRVLPESVSLRTKKGQCTVNILRYGISREIQGFTPFTAFDGIDAVQDVSVESGHVNVKLSHELFSYLLAHVNSVYPTAIAPGESESSEGLALYKMLMLSRQKRGGLIAAESVYEAMWRAFCACDPALTTKKRRLALADASKAALVMVRRIPDRTAVYNMLGDVGACIASLLHTSTCMIDNE